MLGRVADFEVVDPGPGDPKDALILHSPDYLEAVKLLSADPGGYRSHGFSSSDNPPFRGMYEASLAYLAGTVYAAKCVRDGSKLAFGIAGGLHHAHRSQASGFCIFNDAAIACAILRERFDRVAYVDIDVHHGDGVQGLFWDDPSVLTCSIHEGPKTLWPGTGALHEVGPASTSINAPIPAYATGDAWLVAFRGIVMAALEAFRPNAIVIQMGTDTHEQDPLAHLNLTAQEWREAVTDIRDFGVPIVAVGGGGYNLTTVPRMWASACMELVGMPIGSLPADLADVWGMPTFDDQTFPLPRFQGMNEVLAMVESFKREILPTIPRGG